MCEINDQVRKWGINVHSVRLSEAKVLKQPDSGSNTAVGSILKGLGMKDDPKYPTPKEFIKSQTGFVDQPTASLMGNAPPTMNMSLLQVNHKLFHEFEFLAESYSENNLLQVNIV